VKQQDDYIAGPHHYWTQFWCGLLFGAGAGIWVGWQVFVSPWLMVATAVPISLVTGLICGRWGDRGWHWVLHKFGWFS
jgi:hypothetical protein